ncbi:MAG: 23S rRNA (guanosine(2251)-2'-O)-methyltransferase RlmB [Anaeroplasmataceae bacterium]
MIKIYGKNCIYEAVKAGHKMEEVHILDTLKDEAFIKMLKDKGYRVRIDNKKTMDQIFKDMHQGYGAIAYDYEYKDLDYIINKKKDGRKIIVVLDGIQDPHNFGAIIRSCDAFSVDGIVIPKNRSVSITETVVKVSTGAIEYVDIVMVNNLVSSLEKLKENGFWIVGTDANASNLCQDIDKNLNIAVVIGSEGFGMSRLVKKACDYTIKIPMTGHVNSLNASVSAGIIIAGLV